MAYQDTRKKLSKELKQLGVTAPAQAFPLITDIRNLGYFEAVVAQDEQIAAMTQMIANIKNQSEWNNRK